mmetsp:Transcript_14051/g.21918  ORF Transcript_14051/g.21918 Transcript_14051/m.21918 type:complete len:201 (+) Transcript_14051:76-678(+)|eukprot:CAMPEP_0197044542 /NCGR_PEP_ID=MMETSP1384-20130603/20571_1 /TAXON_ID=29189 /ORGANISM="Ammonia sp." /LENGTH=200 /DNA_ID=CAMNT_0042476013 /DNA_START=65 /DNA_END=667 /DNA_ORIENTATION=+
MAQKEEQKGKEISNDANQDIEYIKSKIGTHPNFPKENINFRDVFPVLRDPKGFEMIMNRLCNYVQTKFGGSIDAIVGLDSRGFLFGPIMALRLKCAFVPIRKKGKLPGKCISQQFEKEYGKDVLEIQQGCVKPGDNVIIVDDLLATGGTLEAAYKLLVDEQIKANVKAAVLVIELNDLDGRARLSGIGLKEVYSLIQYDD